MGHCDSKNKLAYLNLATVYTNSQSQDVWWFQCNLIDSEMQLMAHHVLPPLLAIALMQDISHEKGRLLQPNKPAWRLTLRPRIELVLWFDFVLLAPSLSTRQRHCALVPSPIEISFSEGHSTIVRAELALYLECGCHLVKHIGLLYNYLHHVLSESS